MNCGEGKGRSFLVKLELMGFLFFFLFFEFSRGLIGKPVFAFPIQTNLYLPPPFFCNELSLPLSYSAFVFCSSKYIFKFLVLSI